MRAPFYSVQSQSRWQARERFGNDAVKVEGSLEIRTPSGSTSTFQRSAR
jgi:hypothetical protein